MQKYGYLPSVSDCKMPVHWSFASVLQNTLVAYRAWSLLLYTIVTSSMISSTTSWSFLETLVHGVVTFPSISYTNILSVLVMLTMDGYIHLPVYAGLIRVSVTICSQWTRAFRRFCRLNSIVIPPPLACPWVTTMRCPEPSLGYRPVGIHYIGNEINRLSGRFMLHLPSIILFFLFVTLLLHAHLNYADIRMIFFAIWVGSKTISLPLPPSSFLFLTYI